LVQCALVAYIAQRIFSKRLIACIASWIVALYPFLIFYQGLLLSETLFNTLLLAGVAALFWWRERGLRVDSALAVATLCFAMATLTKATLTILPPLLLAATAWLAGASPRRMTTILIATSCLYATFMSPWWIRNAMVVHAFVPFTTGSAQNLYLGNNAHNPNAGIDWSRDVDPIVVATIATMPGERARQQAFNKAALDYIKANSEAFVRAAAKKFVRFWNVVPNAAEFRTSLYSIVSAASFGPILVLALVCVVRWRRQWRMLAPIYLIVGYFTFVHVITIASLRYRLPLEPLLIILAAEPLAACVDFARRRLAQRTLSADNASPS
jgi:4-amino-4-deoxy-L-arabinose transferase-like glycosyltransferase